jgi:hypothetical protein
MATAIASGIDLEAQVKHALGKLTDLPITVQAWQVETGGDWTGQDAVWVWAILDDADLPIDDMAATHEERFTIRKAVRQAVRDVAGDQQVYVRFRTTSEV